MKGTKINQEQITLTNITFSKRWKIALSLSIGFSILLSLFSLSINFQLIKIDKICVWCKGDTKSIVDNSLMFNPYVDVLLKNNIDSVFNVNYTKNVRVLDGNNKLTLTSNEKVNYFNILVNDKYGNTFFIKNDSKGKTIPYGTCNGDYTYCEIYKDYSMENNKNIKPCFEINITDANDYGTYFIAPLIPHERVYEHPEECIEHEHVQELMKYLK